MCPTLSRSTLRAETSIALAEMAGSGGSSGGSKAANQRDALEEARLAGEGQALCAGAAVAQQLAATASLHPPHLTSPSSPCGSPPFPATRCAVEQIVIPQLQPVELLPRDADTIDLQVQLVQSCGLPYEVVGSPTSLRLRVLPPAWANAAETTAGAASVAAPGRAAAEAAAPVIEGGKQKEYW